MTSVVWRSVRSGVRFLLVNDHCISDPTAGVTQSLRTIMEWLAEAGHECRILTTARFESAVTFTIEEHLREQASVPSRPRPSRDAERSRASRSSRRALRRRRVPVTLLLTRHNDEARPDRAETAQYLALLDGLLDDFAPDQLIAVQRASDDLRGDGARAEPRHDDRVCGSRIRLLRAAATSPTSITRSRAAST